MIILNNNIIMVKARALSARLHCVYTWSNWLGGLDDEDGPARRSELKTFNVKARHFSALSLQATLLR